MKKELFFLAMQVAYMLYLLKMNCHKNNNKKCKKWKSKNNKASIIIILVVPMF